MKLLQHRIFIGLSIGKQSNSYKTLSSLVSSNCSKDSLLCSSRIFSCLNSTPAKMPFSAPSSCKFSSKAPGDQDHLVYVGQQADLFKGLKIFSLSTSGIGLLLQPYLLMEAQDLSLAWAVPLFSIVNTFIFVNPILIHYLAKRYALEIYFNPDTKVFTLYRLSFFARKKAISFKAEDVVVPDIPTPFAMFNVKGLPMFAHEGHFSDIEVYKHMMGFDKPLDLTYNVNNNKNEDKDENSK